MRARNDENGNRATGSAVVRRTRPFRGVPDTSGSVSNVREKERQRIRVPRACLAYVALALTTCSAIAFAQGVGINGTGASADVSAMLDVASTTKGFLPPRMTAVQRAAIVSPATGLLVYQSDGTVGLYYNAGTPVAPSWQAGRRGRGGAVGHERREPVLHRGQGGGRPRSRRRTR